MRCCQSEVCIIGPNYIVAISPRKWARLDYSRYPQNSAGIISSSYLSSHMNQAFGYHCAEL
jgi:hypothetical protein